MAPITKKYPPAINSKSLGKIFIISNNTMIPKMKVGVFIVVLDKNLAFAEMKMIHWIYAEVTEDDDIIKDVVQKGDFNPDHLDSSSFISE